MDTTVEKYINKCYACQVTGGPFRPEPIKPTELPCERWSSLATDVCGPFPSGEYVVTLKLFTLARSENHEVRHITPNTCMAR